MSRSYPRDLLVTTAAASISLVDLMRRLDAPLSSGPRRYLRDRLAFYGIDTDHFADEDLPGRQPRVYTRELLIEAASRSRGIRDMLDFMGVLPYDSAYRHLWKRLDAFGIDTSHFVGRRGNGPPPLVPRGELVRAVDGARSLAEVIRTLGLTDGGASRALVKRSIAAYGIDTTHFTGQGHRTGCPAPNRRGPDDILKRLETGSRRTKTALLRRALDDVGMRHSCAECGIGDMWQGKRLVLEIDHINGDRLDNRLGNLRYLCPSCHSQTSGFSRGADRAG